MGQRRWIKRSVRLVDRSDAHIGTPVGFAMAIAGGAGLWLIGGPDMVSGIIQTSPLSVVGSYELLTIRCSC